MGADTVSDALVQILENYERCGLRYVPRQELSDELRAYVDSLQAVGEGTVVAAGSPSTLPGSSASALSAPGSSAPGSSAGGSPINPSPVADAPGQVASTAATPQAVPVPSQPAVWSLPVMDLDARVAKLDEVNQQVRACRACKNIVDFRHQTVFGDGSLQPTICFMGEAPGADEDRQGKPFVGKAGQLLTRIIGAMKLTREEVYILNALKCRPPQNRTPVPDEIDSCRGFVETQLEVLQPKFIVCLGAVAVRSILQSNLSIGRLRGRFHDYRGAKVVVTYHPSYLLRNESAKRLVWEDMKMLMRELGVEL